MKVALVFDKGREDAAGFYVENILRQRQGFSVDHFNTSDAEGIPQGYDLYLRIDHGDYSHDLPANLKPKAFWAMDTHLKHPWRKIQRQASNYDIVFCAFRQAVDELKARGFNAHWVPFACEPGVHKPRDTEKSYDIGYVGTDGKGYRPKLLNALRRRYPDSFIGKADFRQMDSIYSASRIGFNYAIRHRGRKTGCNMRFFEVLACRALLLTNWVEDCRIEDLGFKNGRHLVMYRSKRHLFKLIDYYLKHTDEAEVIAQAGYEMVLERHTYRHRVEKILELMGENGFPTEAFGNDKR